MYCVCIVRLGAILLAVLQQYVENRLLVHQKRGHAVLVRYRSLAGLRLDGYQDFTLYVCILYICIIMRGCLKEAAMVYKPHVHHGGFIDHIWLLSNSHNCETTVMKSVQTKTSTIQTSLQRQAVSTVVKEN